MNVHPALLLLMVFPIVGFMFIAWTFISLLCGAHGEKEQCVFPDIDTSLIPLKEKP